MLVGSGGSGAAAAAAAAAARAAEEARERAEAEARAKEAAEQQKEASEKAQQAAKAHQATKPKTVAQAKFRGKQVESSFERNEGNTRTQQKTTRSGKNGTVETTQRSHSLKNGAKASFYENKETGTNGKSKTTTRTSATTAKGKTQARESTKETQEKRGKTSVSKSGSANVATAQASGQIGNKTLVAGHTTLPGGVKAQGSVTGPGAAFSASASAGLSGTNLKVQVDVNVDAHALEAQGSLEKDVHFSVGGQSFEAKLKLGANAEIGANGELKLDLNVGTSGVSVDASASGFAGAEGSLTGSVELDQLHGKKTSELAQGSLSATAIAGASASASLHAGYSDGKLGFNAHVQAAVGVGAGLSFSGNVDIPNTAVAAKDVALGLAKEGLEDGAKFVANTAVSAFHGIQAADGYLGGLFTGGLSDLKNLAASGLSSVERFSSSALNTVESTGSSAVHSVEHAGSSALHGVEGAGSTLVHGASSLIHDIPNPFSGL